MLRIGRLSLTSLACGVSALAWLGCSSSSFSPSEFDAGRSEDSATDEVFADATLDEGSDAAEVGRDEGVEVSDSGETCAPNECGGCGPLTGKTGDACGECGKLACNPENPNALKCDDPKFNACKGCATLSAKPSESCGSCGGTVVCDGTNAVKCDGATPKNACLGCKTLSPEPGGVCGACKTGKVECSGPESTSCQDPVKIPLGTKCGVCNSSKYVCGGTDGSSKCETPDDTNACKGCAVLANAPGAVCGVCSGGSYVCSGKDATSCNDPIPAGALGAKCGKCSTSKTICASGGAAVACEKEDDRSDITTIEVPVSPDATYSLPLARYEENAIEFTANRSGELLAFSVNGVSAGYNCNPGPIASGTTKDDACRCTALTCSVASPVLGEFAAEVIEGSPASPGRKLGAASLAPPFSKTDVYGALVFKFPAGINLEKGRGYFVRLTSTSTKFAYLLAGDKAGKGILTRYRRSDIWGPATFETDPFVKAIAGKVVVRGCL